MNRASRLTAVLGLLGTAACAADGITAPQLEPEPEAVAARAEAPPALVITCSRFISPEDGAPR